MKFRTVSCKLNRKTCRKRNMSLCLQTSFRDRIDLNSLENDPKYDLFPAKGFIVSYNETKTNLLSDTSMSIQFTASTIYK